MTSREKFEQAIKSRFGDLIDYRVCKNSDGEYMAWDMQVAWWAWQAAETDLAVQLANAESKCRELAAENAEMRSSIDATIGWQESTDPENGESVRMLVDIKTPATDAFLAEVRAQESKRVYESILDNPAVTDMGSLVDWLEQHAEDSASFAAQLRQGAAL
ncbi:hypothetical protein HV310_04185 [Citrobacter freundii]|nr:hypothetical protein [Citrobacter freundii]QMR43972.1 hypothetical protein HV310_04185 [Citrobacter freundii]